MDCDSILPTTSNGLSTEEVRGAWLGAWLVSSCRLFGHRPATGPSPPLRWERLQDLQIPGRSQQVCHKLRQLFIPEQEVGRDAVLVLLVGLVVPLRDGHHLYEVPHCVPSLEVGRLPFDGLYLVELLRSKYCQYWDDQEQDQELAGQRPPDLLLEVLASRAEVFENEAKLAEAHIELLVVFLHYLLPI